jgi:hypothetical protein
VIQAGDERLGQRQRQPGQPGTAEAIASTRCTAGQRLALERETAQRPARALEAIAQVHDQQADEQDRGEL